MADRETIIYGIEADLEGDCSSCPYSEENAKEAGTYKEGRCIAHLLEDILEFFEEPPEERLTYDEKINMLTTLWKSFDLTDHEFVTLGNRLYKKAKLKGEVV